MTEKINMTTKKTAMVQNSQRFVVFRDAAQSGHNDTGVPLAGSPKKLTPRYRGSRISTVAPSRENSLPQLVQRMLLLGCACTIKLPQPFVQTSTGLLEKLTD
jgi:hypothetical protein